MLPASFALKGKVRFILTESGLCSCKCGFSSQKCFQACLSVFTKRPLTKKSCWPPFPPPQDTHTLRHTRNSLFSPKQTEFLHEPDSSPASIWSTFRFGRNQKPPLLTFWTALYFFRFFFSVSASFCLFFKLSTVLIHTFLN